MLGDARGASLVGRQVGSYEILSLLGAGGMGDVYRARDTTLGRDVAIKVVADAFLSDPERLARFEREARVLATLNRTPCTSPRQSRRPHACRPARRRSKHAVSPSAERE